MAFWRLFTAQPVAAATPTAEAAAANDGKESDDFVVVNDDQDGDEEEDDVERSDVDTVAAASDDESPDAAAAVVGTRTMKVDSHTPTPAPPATTAADQSAASPLKARAPAAAAAAAAAASPVSPAPRQAQQAIYGSRAIPVFPADVKHSQGVTPAAAAAVPSPVVSAMDNGKGKDDDNDDILAWLPNGGGGRGSGGGGGGGSGGSFEGDGKWLADAVETWRRDISGWSVGHVTAAAAAAKGYIRFRADGSNFAEAFRRRLDSGTSVALTEAQQAAKHIFGGRDNASMLSLVLGTVDFTTRSITGTDLSDQFMLFVRSAYEKRRALNGARGRAGVASARMLGSQYLAHHSGLARSCKCLVNR
jgi:hypothetical protein